MNTKQINYKVFVCFGKEWERNVVYEHQIILSYIHISQYVRSYQHIFSASFRHNLPNQLAPNEIHYFLC